MKIGGLLVFPRGIEEVLNRHPSIRDSAVVGRPDPMRGEVPVAFIELNDGHQLDEMAVRAFCRESLAQYKVPREIHVMEKLPRSGTGKILRRELK
jgi:acyl-CoA synthetase (AMP-forming)/AMP-acid ligase II